MKTVVIYKSSTGFTEKYATWIASDLQCEAIKFNKKNLKTLSAYDRIIFGSGIMGGLITGLSEFKKTPEFSSKKVIIFATGATGIEETAAINRVKDINFNQNDKDIPFYYFQSGINYERMGFLPKTLLRIMCKSLAKKENMNESEKNMLQILSTTNDRCDRDLIKPLIDSCK